MTFVIMSQCIDVMDKSCVVQCPVDCIYEGERSMYIHPEECIDCGACEATCPVSAIVMDLDLGDDEQHYLQRAEEVFLPLGRLGGAKKHGPLAGDHPDVAAAPPGGR